MVTNKEYEAEKIGIQGQSRKLFFTKGIKLGILSRLLIINIIPAKNKKENDRADNDQKDDGITRKEDSLREDRNWISIPYISCQILEENPIYQIHFSHNIDNRIFGFFE